MKLTPDRQAEEEGDADLLSDASWLYSYADLITQLLLFVILTVTVVGLTEFDNEAQDEAITPEQIALRETLRELDRYVQKEGLEDQMAIDRSADQVVIRLNSQLLFDLGRADLTERANSVLTDLVGLLQRLNNDIRIEGHTDNVPISTARFPSNWELSTSRAISVVDYLESSGIRNTRLSAAGYAEFHPLVPNSNAPARALNRRVEIVILGESQGG